MITNYKDSLPKVLTILQGQYKNITLIFYFFGDNYFSGENHSIQSGVSYLSVIPPPKTTQKGCLKYKLSIFIYTVVATGQICSPTIFTLCSYDAVLYGAIKDDLLRSVRVYDTLTHKPSIASLPLFVPLRDNLSLPVLLLLHSLHHPSMPSPCAVNEECFHLLHCIYSYQR